VLLNDERFAGDAKSRSGKRQSLLHETPLTHVEMPRQRTTETGRPLGLVTQESDSGVNWM